MSTKFETTMPTSTVWIEPKALHDPEDRIGPNGPVYDKSGSGETPLPDPSDRTGPLGPVRVNSSNRSHVRDYFSEESD